MNLELFYRLVSAWILVAIAIFFVLLFIPAPYGRLTKRGWGIVINNRLSWMIMEFPSLASLGYFYFTGTGRKDLYSVLLVMLWIMHYIHRTFVFPLRIRDRVKKMPLVVSFMAIFFNLVNGSVNGYYLGNIFPDGRVFHPFDPAFVSGLVLFFAGAAGNIYSDQILINLRKNNGDSYSIPYGGLYHWLSCPNYFCEIVEWLGYAIMAWSLPAFSFFIWTFANLVPRAIHYHRWYKKNFPDYPSGRKAVIPFIL